MDPFSIIYPRFEDHEAQERFTEQLVLMESLSFYFRHPHSVSNALSDNAKYDLTRLGIPGDSKVVLIPQTLPKFHPSIDGVIRSLLESNHGMFILIIYNNDKVMWKKE